VDKKVVLFEHIADYLQNLTELTERIPKSNLDNALKTKGSTLILIKLLEIVEIKQELNEISKKLSKSN